VDAFKLSIIDATILSLWSIWALAFVYLLCRSITIAIYSAYWDIKIQKLKKLHDQLRRINNETK
jgi:NhaP-type Na+/H+ or K+/H+ antiporter